MECKYPHLIFKVGGIITLPIIAIAVDFVARQTVEQFDDIMLGNIIEG